MSRNFEYLGGMAPDDTGVALHHTHIDAGNPCGILARSHNGSAVIGFQRQIAADVIGVMVGVENMSKLEAARVQQLSNRFRLGGVHHGADALFWV